MRNFILFVAFALSLTACSPNGPKPAEPKNDAGSVKVEKFSCETSGPLQLTPSADGRVEIKRAAARTDRFCAIIVPVDDASLRLIASGRRVFDFRRALPADPISHVVFFNTTTLEIDGIATAVGTIAGTPEELILSTLLGSGTNVNGLLNYFEGRDQAFAIEFKNYRPLTRSLPLAEARALDSKFLRPHGYVFVDRYPSLNSEIQIRRPAL